MRFPCAKAFVGEKVDSAKAFVSEKVDSAKAFVSEKVGPAVNWLKDKGNSFMSSVQEKGRAFADTVRNQGSAIMQWLSGAVNSLISGLEGAKNSAVSGLRGTVNNSSTWLNTQSTNAANFVEEKGNSAANFVDTQSTNAANFVEEKGNSAATTISEQSTNAANFIEGQNTTAANFVEEKGNSAANFVDTQSTKAANFVEEKGNSAATTISEQSTNAANFIAEKGNTVSGFVHNYGNKAVDLVDTAGTYAINFIKNPQEEGQKLLNKAGEGIQTGWEWSKEKAGQAITWSQDKVSQASAAVNENLIKPATGWVQQQWNNLQGWMQSTFPGLTRCWKVFQEYGGVVAGYLKKKAEMVAQWWNNNYPAISAWGHGILDVVGIVGDAIPFAGNIVAAVADILNTIWYVAEGDWTNAGLSAIAIIPYIGIAAKGGKYIGKGLKYVDDIVKLVSKYGDDVIKLFSKYGSKIGELFVKYGDEVIQVFAKYGDEAVELFAKYGDNALKWLKKQGDNASKFTDDTLEKILGKKAKKEIGEETSEELTEKALKEGKKEAGELLAAIAQAKIFTEANDANDTPVPILIGLLNTGFKSQYPVLKTHHFEALPKAPGHYKIIMRSDPVIIDGDYSDSPGAARAKELGYQPAEEGYHWALINGEPVYKRNPGKSDLPERIYDPEQNKFIDKPEPVIAESSTTAKGILGEQKADEFMEGLGYKKIGGHGDKPQGIDGIYLNSNPPPKYVIGEAKYGTSSLGMTEDGLQMSDTWCNNRIAEAVGFDRALAKDIQKSGYTKWLLHYDPATGKVSKKVLP